MVLIGRFPTVTCPKLTDNGLHGSHLFHLRSDCSAGRELSPNRLTEPKSHRSVADAELRCDLAKASRTKNICLSKVPTA